MLSNYYKLNNFSLIKGCHFILYCYDLIISFWMLDYILVKEDIDIKKPWETINLYKIDTNESKRVVLLLLFYISQ
jgi:hypothetical protein